MAQQCALFPLGQVVATPGALEAMEKICLSPIAMLSRHETGDWGDIDPADKGANEKALEEGERVFSVYKKGGMTIWVITEADRSSTCLLTPGEY